MKSRLLLMVLTCWLPAVLASNGPAVAKVNDQEISALRFERYFAEYLEDQGRALGSIRNPKAYKQLRQKALDALIDRELLWQESIKRGVVISDAAVQRQVEQMRDAMGGAEKFARRLEDAGFDEAGFAEYTRHELAAQQTFAQLTQVAPPDETEVRAFFDEHRSEMSQPETVQARHILIKVAQGADATAVEAARLRLVEMKSQISRGADFASVARTGSEDASAGAGGELGYFPRGRMMPTFETAAFALRPGQVSEPVRTPLGWHLIYLQNHLEAADVSESQGLEMVRAYLARQRQVQVRQQVLAQLRSSNRIQRIDGD